MRLAAGELYLWTSRKNDREPETRAIRTTDHCDHHAPLGAKSPESVRLLCTASYCALCHLCVFGFSLSGNWKQCVGMDIGCDSGNLQPHHSHPSHPRDLVGGKRRNHNCTCNNIRHAPQAEWVRTEWRLHG